MFYSNNTYDTRFQGIPLRKKKTLEILAKWLFELTEKNLLFL